MTFGACRACLGFLPSFLFLLVSFPRLWVQGGPFASGLVLRSDHIRSPAVYYFAGKDRAKGGMWCLFACMLALMVGECFANLQRPIKALFICCLAKSPSSKWVPSSSGSKLHLNFLRHRDAEQERLTIVDSLLFLPSCRIVILKASLLAIEHWSVKPGRNLHSEQFTGSDIIEKSFYLFVRDCLTFSGRQILYICGLR